jgi:hypothetical protein
VYFTNADICCSNEIRSLQVQQCILQLQLLHSSALHYTENIALQILPWFIGVGSNMILLRKKNNCPYRTLGCSFDKHEAEILQRRFLNTRVSLPLPLCLSLCVANVFHLDVQRKNQTQTQTHSEKFLPLMVRRARGSFCVVRCRNLQLPRALHKRAFLRFDKLWPSLAAPSE